MTRRRRPRTSEERLVAAVGSVARGVVGGRIRNVRQAPGLERNTGPAASSGSLDSTADPVVIGLNANANGIPGSVVIGQNAVANTGGQFDVAIGYGASVGGSPSGGSGVAVGMVATANGIGAVAIGHLADGEADSCVALGNGATVDAAASSAVAIGDSAYAAGSNSTAIGANATASAAHQIMLGTSLETVVIPGSLSVTSLPTSDPGVSGRVWNNGGVLTVSP